MKGAIGFLVGIIFLCIFASASLLIPIFMRRSEGMIILVIMLVAAFVFLNILILSFYRMLGHLHETVLYPDDAHYQPLRGRPLFFVGYIGLFLTIVFVVMLALLPELLRFRISPREIEPLLTIAWFFGWGFFGCMLGGVLMLVNDIFQKAFFRTMVGPADDPRDDDLDISGPGPRRSSRRDSGDDDRPRRWDDE